MTYLEFLRDKAAHTAQSGAGKGSPLSPAPTNADAAAAPTARLASGGIDPYQVPPRLDGNDERFSWDDWSAE